MSGAKGEAKGEIPCRDAQSHYWGFNACQKCGLWYTDYVRSKGGRESKPIVAAPLPHAAALYAEAERTICGPRRGSYGDVHESFDALARMLSVTLRKKLKEPLTASEACLCMLALKLMRESNAHTHDNLVDVCGYAGLLAELEAAQEGSVPTPPTNPT